MKSKVRGFVHIWRFHFFFGWRFFGGFKVASTCQFSKQVLQAVSARLPEIGISPKDS